MANLTEISHFDSGVTQIEVTEYIEAGVEGIHNVPLRQLTNRTRWLFDRMIMVENAYLYTLPIATRTTLGGVKIGSGIIVEEDGTIHLANPPEQPSAWV